MTLNIHHQSKSSLVCLAIGLLFFFGARSLSTKVSRNQFKASAQESAINFNEEFVKVMSLGQYRLISSTLWSETLLKAGVDHYKGKDLNNWMFRRINLITTLDPWFYQAYLYGGIYLSIIKDDDLGAEVIYDKGLKSYTNDLYLNLNASFHYYYELGKTQKSIEALERIITNPRIPAHIPSLLARLKAQNGSLKETKDFIEGIIVNYPPDSILYQRLRENLNNITIELDLKCLNEGKSFCSTHDPFNKPYIQNKKGLWKTTSPWKKLRIKKKN